MYEQDQLRMYLYNSEIFTMYGQIQVMHAFIHVILKIVMIRIIIYNYNNSMAFWYAVLLVYAGVS